MSKVSRGVSRIAGAALGVLALAFSQGPATAQSGRPPAEAATDNLPKSEMGSLLPEGTPLGSAFAYQGQLKSGGAFVNATCDFQFALFDALTLGAQVGTTQTVSSVSVANGLFNASIDFGQGAFKSEARFLGTSVRCPAGSGSYTALNPRKTLGAVPFALSSAAPWVTKIDNTINYTGGNVGIGTTTPAHRLSIAGGPNWTSNNWSGALELTNASAIGWQANAGGQRFGVGQSTGGLYFFHTLSNLGTTASPAVYDMTISDYGSVGIGTTTPSYWLDVVASGGGTAIYAESPGGWAVDGESNGSIGVKGRSVGLFGVYGQSTNGYGVFGSSTASDGIVGDSSGRDGVVGYSTSGYAGRFNGNVKITGVCCSAPANVMQIDHPLDPTNQTLQQALVESPDMKNIYDGNVTTDEKGDATVLLPGYVDALNGEFRYQLTVIGQFAQAIVATKIKGTQFTIKTDKPNVEVSWQVTGIRKDPYAAQHRVQVEVAKPAGEIGKYLHPEAYGQSESMGVDFGRREALKETTPERRGAQ